MDATSILVLQGANFFCKFSSRTPSSFSSSLFEKNPLAKTAYSSTYGSKFRSWRSSALPNGRIAPVLAQFRPTIRRRRNTLREKKTASREGQVRRDSELFNASDLEMLNSPDDGIEKVGSSWELDNEESLGEKDSFLANKLNNWVNQHKADLEFWGIGTGAIFTIYQDSDGKVLRVAVNEEEIIKRSRSRAWPLEDKGAAEEFNDVNFKFSRAKAIAKETECGQYVFPQNSSIAKFVIEGKKSDFLDGVLAATRRSEPIVKIFPRIGFALLCGCCVLWLVTKFIRVNNEAEPTKEELMMLNRKKISRMKREECEKGRVEVLEPVLEVPPDFSRRPQLDRNRLMDSIKQAEELRENSALTNVARHLNGIDSNDNKIKEIREMVRHVHEFELENRDKKDESSKNYGSISDLFSSKDRKVAKSGHDENLKKTPGDNVPVGKGIEHAMQINNKEDLKGNYTNQLNTVPSPQRKPSSGSIEISNAKNLDDNTTGPISDTLAVAYSGSGTKHSTQNNDAGSAGTLYNVPPKEERAEQNKIRGFVAQETKPSTKFRSSLKSSSRTKPRIIRTVKEAREYLVKKGKTLSGKAEGGQRVQMHKEDTGHEISTSNADLSWSSGQSTQTVESLGNTHDAMNTANSVSQRSCIDNPCVTRFQQGCKNSDSLPAETDDSKVGDKKNLNFHTSEEKPINSSMAGVMSDSAEVFHRGAQEVTDHQTTSSKSAMEKLDDDHRSFINNISFDESSVNSSSKIVVNNIVQPQIDDAHYFSEQISNEEQFSSEKRDKSLQSGAQHFELENKGNKDREKDEDVGNKTKVIQSFNLDSLVGCSESSLGVNLSAEQHNSKSVRTLSNDSPEEHRSNHHPESVPIEAKESWIQKNFEELDPIIRKIGIGFKENYMVAKQKEQQLSLSDNIRALVQEDEELEWMNDESLRKIVFQVRENELAGRDPFHMIDDNDKLTFFKGLEDKAEKVNKQLLPLHEWIHSRVENLDYGADGISVYDPVEKIIPRWKGPSFDKDPEFLSKLHKRERKSSEGKGELVDNPREKEDATKSSRASSYTPAADGRKQSVDESAMKTRIIVESSDGTSRPGRKGGKEQWQHTKKWSQGFLEVYNAETDPEVKSIMRSMGKDLDRWVTEKESQDVADLMTKIPKRKRKYIEKKLDRIRREVEKFGAPAVVSKYREYSDEKEDDYLWWLDLRFVLCIELYTIEEGVPKAGFYSLEMAADLGLEPKQYHVIAFEDPGDSKNFCYIMQAHMDMLGSGKAFVVARSAKDAFREAKANGFNVTVIRKGEIKLNVDQTLEEIEEEITEIGSKPYHDKIMKERSVDIRTLMKGVITADKSRRRKSRPRMMKPTKS